MQHVNDIFRFLPCLLAVLLASCSFGDEPALCPYNTRLEYWYAGNSSVNELPVYANRLQQYLFDSEGRLLQCDTLKGEMLTRWSGELEPGKYTVVVWANMQESGKESVSVLPEGEDRLSDLTLSAVKKEVTEGVTAGYRSNTGRLYYGTATFTVEPGLSASRRVYLSHAHAALKVTVVWRIDPPPPGGTYRMRLKYVPALYGFVKGWESPLPSGDGEYTVPRIDINTMVNHETSAAMNYDGDVAGSFVSFRYSGSSHPTWSLWRDGEEIVRGIDLYKFFHDPKININLDENIAQEFDIVITIYEDKIIVSLAGTSDWYEGGSFYW